MTGRISFTTVRALASVIMGDPPQGMDSEISPYRTHKRLDEFFGDDLELEVDHRPDGSRLDKTNGWLRQFREGPDLKRIVEAAVRPIEYEGTPWDVDKAVEYLNEHLTKDGYQLVRVGEVYRLHSTSGVVVDAPRDPQNILSSDYVQEMIDKCNERLAGDDGEGAVTVARTLLEAVLEELEERLAGTKNDYKGDLQKQYRAIAKLLKIEAEREDLDKNFKQVAQGLLQVVNGLAPIRNKMSDGHARTRKPAPHHARVVVNAAKTVAAFLVDSYSFQVERGTLAIAEEDR